MKSNKRIPEIRSAAEAGDSQSQYLLGWHCYLGYKVTGDRALAIQWLTQASQNGNVAAKKMLDSISLEPQDSGIDKMLAESSRELAVANRQKRRSLMAILTLLVCVVLAVKYWPDHWRKNAQQKQAVVEKAKKDDMLSTTNAGTPATGFQQDEKGNLTLAADVAKSTNDVLQDKTDSPPLTANEDTSSIGVREDKEDNPPSIANAGTPIISVPQDETESLPLTANKVMSTNSQQDLPAQNRVDRLTYTSQHQAVWLRIRQAEKERNWKDMGEIAEKWLEDPQVDPNLERQ